MLLGYSHRYAPVIPDLYHLYNGVVSHETYRLGVCGFLPTTHAKTDAKPMSMIFARMRHGAHWFLNQFLCGWLAKIHASTIFAHHVAFYARFTFTLRPQ